MNIRIPLYQPSLNGNEKKYVNDCLNTGWISAKGKYVEKFEKTFAEKNEVKYASSVCNGTVAIHLALLSLGINSDDEVIVPTLTYVASVNPITYIGAKPIFADSIRETWQIDPKDVEKKITNKTKAIIVVHLYGHACNMEAIIKIAKKYNLFVVEDCAEAVGSKFLGKSVGTFGDIATFSFFGNKTITTGEGGMVITNNQEIHNRCIHLKSQGLKPNTEYWHDIIGYNYRMNNVCAAIGLAQLDQLDNFVKKKRELFYSYKEQLIDLPLKMHEETDNVFHTFWLVNILVENLDTKENLRDYLGQNGIETRPIFYPIDRMPMYYDKSNKFPIADYLSQRGISLPSWPGLLEKDVLNICKTIRDFYSK
jgi:perosamine synthetase